MANDLSAVASDLYKAAEIVGREAVGALNSVIINGGSEAVALNSSVKSLRTDEPTLNTSVTPAMTIPEGDDNTPTEQSFTLSKTANVKMNITGEEQVKIDTNYSFDTYQGYRFLQAFRKLRNQMEADLCTAIYKGASRAFGTAGTTPFASNFNEIAELRQIIFDNGFLMPGEMSIVLNSLAGTNLRQLAQLQKANESADGGDFLRNGELLNLQGFSLKESAGIQTHTKGTGTSYQTSAAEALKSTTINADTGSGTIIAGDVVTFTGDSINKYIVNTALSGGSFTIGAPGIQSAVADNTALAVGNNYTANLAICRPCVEFAVRPLAAPARDAALDVMTVQDPLTGIAYEVREYGGFHKAMWSITMVYDAKVWDSAGVAVLIG